MTDKPELPEIAAVFYRDDEGGYVTALPVDETPVKLLCVPKFGSAMGDSWTWFAIHTSGRTSSLTLNLRYHYASSDYTFRARVNGGNWYTIEDDIFEDRARDLKTLFLPAMTRNRYFDTYQEVLLTQSGLRQRIRFGI